MKFAHYFVNGNCLFVQGRFEKREYRNDWNFKIADICLLETIKRVMTRQMQINMNPGLFTEKHLEFIEKNMREHPGKSRLKFVFKDSKNGSTVTLTTMDKGFEMNDEMAAFLLENPDLETVIEAT